MDGHIKIIRNETKDFECEICDRSFGYKKDLQRHFNTQKHKKNVETNEQSKFKGK